MALKKLSLRRKAADDEPAPDATPEKEAPKKLSLHKAAPAPEPEPEEPKAAGAGEETEPAEETPAPKKLAAKKPTPPADPELADEPDPSELAVVPSRTPIAMGAITGEINERDLMRPRIQLVQNNSSDLEEKGFGVGQIVLNSEVLIWEKGFDPLKVILLAGRKKFVQRLSDEEYKANVIPMVFDSATDAQEAGFETEWQDKEPPQVDPALYCLMLLEQPEFIEPDPIFSLSYEGRKFTIAELKLGGVNYRSSSSGRWLMTQSRTSLVPDTRSFTLAMTCVREKQVKSGNIVTVASFKNLGAHDDAGFDAWVKSLG
jgi:hypothetical protein